MRLFRRKKSGDPTPSGDGSKMKDEGRGTLRFGFGGRFGGGITFDAARDGHEHPPGQATRRDGEYTGD
jgi:hypothetical protein